MYIFDISYHRHQKRHQLDTVDIMLGVFFLFLFRGYIMCLYHVSEEPNIQVFKPRLPERKDLDQNIGLVWALDEARLPNFLTPRDCPRVAYHTDTLRPARYR